MAEPAARPRERSSEESLERWLAVLIAFVTLLVGITTFLQTDSSSRAAQNYRRAQENAVASTGARTRGQEEVAFSDYVVAREFDELWATARRLNEYGDAPAARAYLTASQKVGALTPLLQPPLTTVNANNTRTTDVSRYEVNTWVITGTILSERRAAAAQEASEWDSKGNNYVAAIAVFAVSLFLLGLASTLAGCIRVAFIVLGMGLAAVSAGWVTLTALQPVHQVPDAAIQRFAQGYGYAWQYEQDQAIEEFSQAIQLDPSYAAAYYERGSAWMHIAKPDLKKAIDDLQKSSALDSNRYSTFWNLGWAYYLVGDYTRSVQASQRANELNSQVCGPAFNIAIARLAQGNVKQADADYAASIALCEKILKDSLAVGLGAPTTLWRDMEASAEDIENLLCQTHRQHCYPERETPDVSKIANRDALQSVGERYLRQIRQALTALEYQHTVTIKPTGGRFTPLVFGNKFYSDDDTFQSYMVRQAFPYNGSNIYALWDYTGMSPEINTVWKVYHDGSEKPDLRYAGNWGLKKDGGAEKKIDSWYILAAGHYEVEVYGNGELIGSGAFDIAPTMTLTPTFAANVKPSAPVTVGDLLLADDFADNSLGWWSGTTSEQGAANDEGTIANGEYAIVQHEAASAWAVTCNACGNLGDIYYEATARYGSGPKDYGYGLVLRGDRGMKQKYLFEIDANGAFIIMKMVNGEYVTLKDWAPFSAIQKNGTNRLGVLARGNSFEFFINGKSAYRINDVSLTRGYVGLAVGTTDLSVAFSQLRVWSVR